MVDFFDSLALVSPLLAGAAKALLILFVGLLIWLVASIPAAIVHVALGRPIVKLANFLGVCGKNLFAIAGRLYLSIAALRDQVISSLTVRYAYGDSETRLQRALKAINQSLLAVGGRLDGASSSLGAALNPLVAQTKQLLALRTGESAALEIPDLKTLQDSNRARRTAAIMLLVCIPIATALIVVNTALLTKFFESFFEEYISYAMGIKWATMIALLFSIIELSLGVFYYHYSKEENPDPLLGPAKKLLFLFLVVALALIEAYLYMLLSADIAKQLRESRLNLPAGLEGMHTWWLAPFGFVVVITLSLIGHAVMDGINRFSDSGHLKDLRSTLNDIKASLASVDSIWNSLASKTEAAKTKLSDFAEEMMTSASPVSVLSSVRGELDNLRKATAMVAADRRDPISNVTTAEAASLYRTHVFLAVVFAFVAIAFTWMQVHFMTMLPTFATVSWAIFLLLAVVEAGAVVFASYKAYPSVTTVLEGAGAEVIRSPGEKAMSWIAALIVAACVVLNLFLTRQESGSAWTVTFCLALVAIAALVLLGRTLPITMLVVGVMLRQVLLAIGSVVVIVTSAASWLLGAVVRIFSYGLYFVAYPFLALVWRSRIRHPAEEIDSDAVAVAHHS